MQGKQKCTCFKIQYIERLTLFQWLCKILSSRLFITTIDPVLMKSALMFWKSILKLTWHWRITANYQFRYLILLPETHSEERKLTSADDLLYAQHYYKALDIVLTKINKPNNLWSSVIVLTFCEPQGRRWHGYCASPQMFTLSQGICIIKWEVPWRVQSTCWTKKRNKLF